MVLDGGVHRRKVSTSTVTLWVQQEREKKRERKKTMVIYGKTPSAWVHTCPRLVLRFIETSLKSEDLLWWDSYYFPKLFDVSPMNSVGDGNWPLMVYVV